MWSPFFQPNLSAFFFPATKPFWVFFHSSLTAGSIVASSKILSKYWVGSHDSWPIQFSGRSSL